MGIWQRLTGQPWTTSRSAAVEFGPPPAADPRYAEALQGYSDAELVERGHAVLAEIRAQQAAVQRLLDHANQLADLETTP